MRLARLMPDRRTALVLEQPMRAEPSTPANAGRARWFQCKHVWPGIAEFCRSAVEQVLVDAVQLMK